MTQRNDVTVTVYRAGSRWYVGHPPITSSKYPERRAIDRDPLMLLELVRLAKAKVEHVDRMLGGSFPSKADAFAFARKVLGAANEALGSPYHLNGQFTMDDETNELTLRVRAAQ